MTEDPNGLSLSVLSRDLGNPALGHHVEVPSKGYIEGGKALIRY